MIYLDHAATTPTLPEVTEAMLPYLAGCFGNPSSIHAAGRQARAAIDASRDVIARAIHADYSEITFTGGGTEADNLALNGAMLAAPADRNHLVVSAIEHHAVLHTAQFLESSGFGLTIVPADREGFVDLDALGRAVTNRTALVSLMHANNEIGTIQDVARAARIAHSQGALFHTDAVQSFGYLPLHVRGIECDLMSLSAHKVYGPKGVGALYVRSGVKLSPLLHGGAQERERRAGTENVAGIVGFGRAAEMIHESREEETGRLAEIRDRFIGRLLEEVPGARLNGPAGPRRMPNNVNVSVEGVDGPALLMSLDRMSICASSGSACSSGSIEPSHVLRAIGLSASLASSGVRFSLGRTTTPEQVDTAVEAMREIVRRLRG